jgi:hypothetical protein
MLCTKQSYSWACSPYLYASFVQKFDPHVFFNLAFSPLYHLHLGHFLPLCPSSQCLCPLTHHCSFAPMFISSRIFVQSLSLCHQFPQRMHHFDRWNLSEGVLRWDGHHEIAVVVSHNEYHLEGWPQILLEINEWHNLNLGHHLKSRITCGYHLQMI